MAQQLTLARSCVIPDETFANLADACARLVALCDGAPVIVRHAAVARGPDQINGQCLAVHRTDKPLGDYAEGPPSNGKGGQHYETVGYVFMRPTTGEDAVKLADACYGQRRAFLKVARDEGPHARAAA